MIKFDSADIVQVEEQKVPTSDGGAVPTYPLHKKDWEVRLIGLKEAQDFISKWHYAKGGSNTRTHCFGLFKKGEGVLLGVTWFLPPTKNSAMNTHPNGEWKKVLALSRLALHPEVPKNGASFLLMHSVREVKKDKRFDCLVTYADEWQGHTGGIYRASGWEYKGKTKPERVYVNSRGRMVSRKAGPKTRDHKTMLSLGNVCLGSFSKHKFVLFYGKKKEVSGE